MPPTNSRSRPYLLESTRDGFPAYARLIVWSRTTELPSPSDDSETILANSRGRFFVAANNSTKTSCITRFPGLRCEFFFAPGRDDVLFDVLSCSSPPDVMLSAPAPGSSRASQSFEGVTTRQCKLPLSPANWTLRWADPHDARRTLSANVAILPRPFSLSTTQPASSSSSRRRRRPAAPPPAWDHALLGIRNGDSFVIRSPAHFRSVAAENYRVVCVRKLYQGNSVVFVGRHDNYGTVAVKFLKLTSARVQDEFYVPERIREWTREVQTLRQLNHPNIVQYISSDARLCSIVTEHKPWDSLERSQDQMRPGYYFRGDHQDAGDILRDMAAALHYLDSKAVSHNDIRPANMLYQRGQPCVLVDFGAACSHDEVNPLGMCHYLCPEYLIGRRRGAGSDVFSMGVVMLWVLRLIPLPEATEPVWDVFTAASGPDSSDATRAFRWHIHLQACREKLSSSRTGIERLTFRMLDPSPETRISALELLSRVCYSHTSELHGQ